MRRLASPVPLNRGIGIFPSEAFPDYVRRFSKSCLRSFSTPPADNPAFHFLDRKRNEGKHCYLHDRCGQQVPENLLRYCQGLFSGAAAWIILAFLSNFVAAWIRRPTLLCLFLWNHFSFIFLLLPLTTLGRFSRSPCVVIYHYAIIRGGSEVSLTRRLQNLMLWSRKSVET